MGTHRVRNAVHAVAMTLLATSEALTGAQANALQPVMVTMVPLSVTSAAPVDGWSDITVRVAYLNETPSPFLLFPVPIHHTPDDTRVEVEAGHQYPLEARDDVESGALDFNESGFVGLILPPGIVFCGASSPRGDSYAEFTGRIPQGTQPLLLYHGPLVAGDLQSLRSQGEVCTSANPSQLQPMDQQLVMGGEDQRFWAGVTVADVREGSYEYTYDRNALSGPQKRFTDAWILDVEIQNMNRFEEWSRDPSFWIGLDNGMWIAGQNVTGDDTTCGPADDLCAVTLGPSQTTSVEIGVAKPESGTPIAMVVSFAVETEARGERDIALQSAGAMAVSFPRNP